MPRRGPVFPHVKDSGKARAELVMSHLDSGDLCHGMRKFLVDVQAATGLQLCRSSQNPDKFRCSSSHYGQARWRRARRK